MSMESGSKSAKPPGLSVVFIYLGLTSLIWLVFGQTIEHQFVAYDDPNYVYQNPLISAGLSGDGLRAAFTQPHARNWHPLTTLSHMLDCQLFGLNPAGHHFTNVLLHTGAALLLFAVLRGMTRTTWPSAFAAALFAIHPLRVESVAWVAERKDVLSAFFFMLTLAAYFRYTTAPSWRRYVAVFLVFALGLMSKPMLVTTPLLLLLLDYWPLRRFQKPDSRTKLILEKAPLLVLSLVTGIATLIAQRTTVGYGEQTPLLLRLSNACASCFSYIGQMFWPAKLAVFYPQSIDGHSIGEIFLWLGLLVLITATVFRLRKSRPYLVVGWLWYLLCLLPVLGFIPVGLQAHADRYTYLPQIGLYIALTWLAVDLIGQARAGRHVLALVSSIVVVILSWLAWAQTSTWRDTETLWKHALAVTTNNDLADYNLARFCIERGQIDEAIAHYQHALVSSGDREIPAHLSAALVHNDLGVAFATKGREDEAAAQYRRAIELRHDFADAHTNLAGSLLAKGAAAEAIEHYRKAASIPPEDADSHRRLAVALQQSGELAEAMTEFRRASEIANDQRVTTR